MEISHAEFVKSSKKLSELPPNDVPEYAFVGRSNVGKSSWINCLCNRRKLAKTSSTPGKTQLINHFSINKKWYLVDLPGYGYAKVSKEKRYVFGQMIKSYLINRDSLMNVFVLIDGRIPPQDIDLDFIRFLGEEEIPFTILFTKIDKVKGKKREEQIRQFQDAMQEEWEEFPQMIQTSSKDKLGREEVLDFIDQTNKLF